MVRTLPSIKSSHLVMWSSPVLLLVLVFTLTSTSSPARPRALARPISSPRSSATTSTTTTLATATLKRTTSTTTPATKGPNFVDVTESTAKAPEPALGAVAPSGVLSGALNATFDVADIPVRGPGLWTLTTSSPLRAHLTCASAVAPVGRRVVIWTSESCQLQLTSTDPEVSPTWQLTPTR